MSDLYLDLRRICNQLRLALKQDDEDKAYDFVEAIKHQLSENKFLEEMYDERLLSELLILLKEYNDSEPEQYLTSLKNHLNTVTFINQKLFAVLDYNISIQDLLYVHLKYWEVFDAEINCIFDQHMEKLSDIREKLPLIDRLNQFFETYFNIIEKQADCDYQRVGIIKSAVERALKSYEWYAQEYKVNGLFAINHTEGAVYGIKIRQDPASITDNSIEFLNKVSPTLETAANSALRCAKSKSASVKHHSFGIEISRSDLQYDGDSIGLALTIGILICVDSIELDIYTALTGHVEWNTGKISRIGSLEQKIRAAHSQGIRRIFYPRDNQLSPTVHDNIECIPVDNIDEVLFHLKEQHYDTKSTSEAVINRASNLLNRKHIRLIDKRNPTAHQIQLVFSDNVENMKVDLWPKNMKYKVAKSTSPLGKIIDDVFNTLLGDKTEKSLGRDRAKYSPATPQLREKIRQQVFLLSEPIQVQEEAENNCQYRAKVTQGSQTVFVRQFHSGTLTIEGTLPLFETVNKQIGDLLGGIENIPSTNNKSEKLAAQEAAVRNIVLSAEWIGTDESGKGDFFGPLVTAAVFVNAPIAEKLTEIGVADSKKISDKKILELAPQIFRICGNRCKWVDPYPETYNQKYAEFKKEGKNLNTLLAWMHTRALEDILERFKPQGEIVVVIDKFADERFINSKLMATAKNTNLRLEQLPKAEINIAVAAASIVARARFLQRMQEMSGKYQVEFPKGASDPRIIEIGKQIVARYGRDELAKVAKIHFKTANKILSGRD